MYKRVKRCFLRLVCSGLAAFLFVLGLASIANAATAGVHITGTVTTTAGNVLANVSVTATDPGGTAVRFGPSLTNASGSYQLDVDSGTYDFHFVPPAGSSVDPIVFEGVTVLADQVLSVQLVIVVSPHVFSGTVRDVDGGPVAGALIQLKALPSGPYTSLFTDASGQVSATVPGAEYQIKVFGDGLPGLPPSFSITGVGTPYFADLRYSDQTRSYQLPAVATLTLLARDVNGNPVPDLAASAANSVGTINASASGVTDATGTFTALLWRAPLGSGCVTFSTGKACSPGTTTLANGDTTVTLTQPVPISPHVFSGTVRDVDGGPVAGALIQLKALPSGPYTSLFTDASGQVSATVPGAEYQIKVFGDGLPGLPPSFSITGVGTPYFADLRYSDQTRSYQLPAVATLTLLARDVNGNPVPDLAASAANSVGTINASASGVTDATGTFTALLWRAPLGSGCVTFSTGKACSPGTTTLANGDTTVLLQQEPVVPATPTGLSGTTPTNHPPALTWNPVVSAVGYRVFRDGVSVATTTDPTFVDSAVSASGSYSYTVQANAQNTTSVSSAPFVVAYDITSPTITATLTRAPNGVGWTNGTVTVTFTCTDALSGVAACSAPTTLDSDGAGQTVTGTAVDGAGNSATSTVTVNIDKTAPVLGAPAWSTNPKPLTSSTTLTVAATDTLSALAGGEYYVDSDPGLGNATAMTLGAGSLSAVIGTNLPVGVYQVGIRAKDAADNWSPATMTMLVVYDPAIIVGVTGKNKKDLVPSLANGDILPGLTTAGQTDPADYGFTVDYTNGALDPRNDFMFTYSTGIQCNSSHPQNCHTLNLTATGFDWMVIDQSDSRGRFHGVATVTVDGVTTSNPFTVEGIDGDRLSPSTSDRLILKVYPPGADPTTATPAYQASGSMPKGNAVQVR